MGEQLAVLLEPADDRHHERHKNEERGDPADDIAHPQADAGVAALDRISGAVATMLTPIVRHLRR